MGNAELKGIMNHRSAAVILIFCIVEGYHAFTRAKIVDLHFANCSVDADDNLSELLVCFEIFVRFNDLVERKDFGDDWFELSVL